MSEEKESEEKESKKKEIVMAITIKTIAGVEYEIKVKPEDTVGAVKKKFESESGIKTENTNLVYLGAVLKDDKTLEESKCATIFFIFTD
jgi:UV excision repair protein RAD23